jgi:hypothetical protein
MTPHTMEHRTPGRPQHLRGSLTCAGVADLAVIVHIALHRTGSSCGPREGVLTVLYSADKQWPGILQQNTVPHHTSYFVAIPTPHRGSGVQIPHKRGAGPLFYFGRRRRSQEKQWAKTCDQDTLPTSHRQVSKTPRAPKPNEGPDGLPEQP